MALHNRMLIGLVLGAAAGIWINLSIGSTPQVEWVVANITEPLGRVWLNALFMVVIPLVISTLALAISGMGGAARLGRIAGLTVLSFLLLSTIAAVLGVGLAGLIRPGTAVDPMVREELMTAYQGESSQAMGIAKAGLGIDNLISVVPRNPMQAIANGEMLAILFLALMIGVALTQVGAIQARPLLAFFESVAHVAMRTIDIVMMFAPYAVALLIFSLAARFGFDLLRTLAGYVLTVIAGLAVLMFVVYPVVLKLVAGRDPVAFFSQVRLAIVTGFATSSSLATLPASLRVAEEQLRIPNEVAGFVVPLGAAVNMNGTALFHGVTILFVAQTFGIDLTLTQQVMVVLTAVVVAVGAANVPGGLMPLVMMGMGLVGVPMEGIAIVLGVDSVLDMFRATVNVVGDMVAATVVHRFAGVPGGTIL
jgi:DAACS family dicarboxylate/amino acid:cation (Na+ or H+) symporter